MRSPTSVRPRKPRSGHAKNDPAAILVMPKQSRESIRVRQEIRESLHDARAHTIKGRRQ